MNEVKNVVVPDDLEITLKLNVSVVNFILKVLDDSHLSHVDIKTVSKLILEQGKVQVDEWMKNAIPNKEKEEVPEQLPLDL